jgi:hypothetical protein
MTLGSILIENAPELQRSITEVNHRAFITRLDNEGQFAHLESLLNAPT